MDELIKGWRFSATLQLRTPLAVLDRHGQYVQGSNQPGDEPETLWHGGWVPVTRTWSELSGMDLPEFESMMASEIGPVPVHGGEFLPFLKRMRAIAENPSELDRWPLLLAELARPESIEFGSALGGAEAIRKKLKIRRPRRKAQ